MWHCEWQQFLFKGGNFQNLAKCKCYANYFIIVLPAKRKEQNSRQKKNKPFCRSSILANAGPRQTTQLHTAAASWGHWNFASATDLQHSKASRRYRWRRTRIRGQRHLKWWWIHRAGRLGGDPSTYPLLPTAPLPSQSQISRSKRAQYSASLSPARALLCTCLSLWQKKRSSHPWVLCALLGSLGQALTKPKWLRKHLRRTAAMSTHS